MVAGEGGPQAGNAPLLAFSVYQLELKKLLTGTPTRGDVLGLNGSKELITCTTAEVDQFFIAKRTKGNGDPKIPVLMPGSIGYVNVPNGQTASYMVKQVIGATAGAVQDRVAEAATKTVGWAMGTWDQFDGKVVNGNVAGPNVVLMYVRHWDG
jgi:hypothetical protein